MAFMIHWSKDPAGCASWTDRSSKPSGQVRVFSQICPDDRRREKDAAEYRVYV